MATKIINVLKDDKFQDILDIFNNTSANEVIIVLPKKHIALAREDHFEALSTAAEDSGKSILILTGNTEIHNLALQYNFGVLTSEKPGLRKSKKVKEMPVIESVEVVQPAEAAEPEALFVKNDDADEVNDEDDDNDEDADEDEGDENDEEDEEDEETDDDADDDQEVSAETVAETEEAEESSEDVPVEVPANDDDVEAWSEDSGAPAFHQQGDSYFPEVELAAVRQPTKIVSDIVDPGKEGEKVKIGISKKAEKSLSINIKREIPKPDIDEIESVWQRPARTPMQSGGSLRGAPLARQATPPVRDAFGKIKFEKIHFPSGGFGSSFFRMSSKTLSYLGGGVVVIFAVVLYLTTGSAQVSVKLKSYPLDFNLKVSASDKFLSIDQDQKRIPGQLFSAKKEIEETFNATGERDVVQKARGKITVYNEYGTSSQVLVATTRFATEDGLIFRTLQTVTVPGTKVVNGKILPGSIQVDIIADKAGDTYNVAPGKFYISAFKEKGDSDRYEKFYGRSEVAMKGGIIGKAKVVTEQDYNDAKRKIEERIITETEQELKSQAAGLKILSLSQPVVKDVLSSAQIDEATDTFTFSGKAEIETVGFKESDLLSLMADYVNKVNALMVLPEKLKTEFKDLKFNSDDKTLEFTVSFSGPGYKKINQEKMISDLIGKNEQQMTDYVKGVDGISAAKIVLSPFWVRKVPANKEKIKFEIQYE